MNFNESAIVASITRLTQKGVPFEAGLTDNEVSSIQHRFGFEFPPELRYFLQTALPVSNYFPNWRHESESRLRARFIEPIVSGILFDVEHNTFWYPEWGERPSETSAAIEFARDALRSVPRLVPISDPIFIKCIPCDPCEPGNPVFSVNQADVLHAGRDLVDFLRWFSQPSDEIGDDPTPVFCEDYRPIQFWTEVARWNNTAGTPAGVR